MSMVLVINTKGGSGKSTAAMQLIAPWVLDRTGKATLVELDDENHDSADFTSSAIQSERVKVGKEVDAEFAIDELMTRTDDAYVIADIGGNRTSAMALEHIGNRGYDSLIDLIVIPVSSPGQDVENAKKTIAHVRDLMPGYKGKILMVLTRTNSDEARMVRRRMPDAFALIDREKLAGPIILPSNDAFPLSRNLQMTVWEVAEQAPELKKHFQAQMEAAPDAGKREENGFILSVINNSVKMRKHLELQCKELDKVLDLRKVTMKEAPAAKSA